MYRDLKASSAGWVRKKSYCNTVGCIARGGWFKEKIVLQNLYCEVQWQETRLPVSQDRQLCREAGRWAGRGSRLGAQAGRWARRQGAGRAGGRRRRAAGAGRAGGRRRCVAGAWADVGCNTPKYTLVVFDMFRVFCKHNLNVS